MSYHIQKIIKPFFFSLLVVLCYALLVRFTINPANASILVDQQSTASGAVGGKDNNTYSVTFTPTKNNLYSFRLAGRCDSGDYATTTFLFELYSGSHSLRSEYYSIKCNSNSTLYPEWILSEPHELSPGSPYRVEFTQLDTPHFLYTIYPSPVNYRTFYDSTFQVAPATEERDVTIIDFNPTMGFDYQMISFNEDNFCMATSTETCSIPFRFNDYAVGSVVYAYISDNGSATGTLLATTTITDNIMDTGYLNVPYSTDYIGEKKQMCAWLHDPLTIEDDKMICNWSIDWLSQSEMDTMLARYKITEYDITEACQEMDQSASTTFAYGIECGLRKVVYWATKPSAETQMSFLTATSNLKSQFPMSVFYQVKDNLMRLPTEWATTSTSTLPSIPLKWAGQDTGVDILNVNTISGSEVGTTWETFNDYLSYFIYFLTFLYFVTEIFSTANRQKNDN